MKKVLVLLTVLTGLLMTGCGNSTPAEETGGSETFKIVATIFPEYDWVREIIKGAEGIELSLLVDNGVDLHSFEPTVQDMAEIASCDLFLYTGGVSDQWVEEALQGSVNEDQVVMNLMSYLDDVPLAPAHDESCTIDHDHTEDEHLFDEHIWLSLKNAETLTGEIAAVLGELDSENAALYSENAAAYQASLAELDKAYEEAAAASRHKTLVFGDRFPFLPLTVDYGLTYFAAFPGCSAETEASFETITFLSEKVDLLDLPAVLTIEIGDGKIARTIVENTKDKDQQILTMNSMQSTTLEEAEAGVTYLSLAEENLAVLQEALK